jgi:2-polyprenyl-3-methyl-5-hydroxy-6-metoxy-1,4-benzoquinol methylase
MSSFKNIINYFDKKSMNYNKNSNSFPWSFIRKIESREVLKLVGNLKNKEVLDFGSGSGFYSKIVKKKNPKKIFALDASKKMLKKIKDKTIIKINQNAENLRIKKKFDIIICAGLFEFVKSPHNILKKLKISSKKDCRLIILCPSENLFAKIYKLNHSKNGLQINLFNQVKIDNIFKKSGWKIVKQKKILFSIILLAKLEL